MGYLQSQHTPETKYFIVSTLKIWIKDVMIYVILIVHKKDNSVFIYPQG